VDLPQIQVVGLEAIERFLEHPHGERFVAAVRADFGHQKNAIATAFERAAEPLFGLAAMIFPAVVEECDATIDGFVDDLLADFLIFGIAQMMPTASDGRDLHSRASEVTHGDSVGIARHAGVVTPSIGRPGICHICFVALTDMTHFMIEDGKILTAGGAEAARATRRIGEIAFFPLHSIVGGDNQLRDAVAFFDDVVGLAEIEHHHANFAAVAGIDSAEVDGDGVLEGEPATWPDLRFAAGRKLDGDTGGHGLRGPGESTAGSSEQRSMAASSAGPCA
jgi:hypothetical protein